MLCLSVSGSEAGNPPAWILNATQIPTIGFYRALHCYLKQHFKSSKTAIGKLYCSIDSNLQEKGSRPDNIYRFVERIVSSKRHSEERMPYDTQRAESMPVQLKKCTSQLEELNSECTELKKMSLRKLNAG